MNRGSWRDGWILGGMLGAAAAAYMFFFFLPGVRLHATTLAELTAKQDYILAAHNSRQLRDACQRELAETLGYCEQSSAQLVKPGKLPILYGQISQIAKAHGVTTTGFKPQRDVAYESCYKHSITLALSGGFAAIHRLAAELEALPEQIWITKLELRSPRQTGKSMECDLTLVVFVDNPEKTD